MFDVEKFLAKAIFEGCFDNTINTDLIVGKNYIFFGNSFIKEKRSCGLEKISCSIAWSQWGTLFLEKKELSSSYWANVDLDVMYPIDKGVLNRSLLNIKSVEDAKNYLNEMISLNIHKPLGLFEVET